MQPRLVRGARNSGAESGEFSRLGTTLPERTMRELQGQFVSAGHAFLRQGFDSHDVLINARLILMTSRS
jgi:hypothetical protein